jgi:hypothetical protein
LLDQALEVRFQLTGDCRRSPGAGVVHEAWRAVVGKAMDPLTEGGIGKGQRVRDGLEALAFDDFTHGLGPAKDSRRFRLFHEGI